MSFSELLEHIIFHLLPTDFDFKNFKNIFWISDFCRFVSYTKAKFHTGKQVQEQYHECLHQLVESLLAGTIDSNRSF